MRIHCIQHEMFETPGCIIDWVNANAYSISYTHIYKNEVLPFIDSFDFLLIMGGSMSTYDENQIEWLKSEKLFIKQVIDCGKYVVGICLGSQLIADVLGSKVYPNKYKEIGFMPIYLTSVAQKIKMFKGFTQNNNAFHWHGDTFDLPKGAVHLAYSHACHNQVFLFENRVLALQCHLEITKEIMNSLIDEFGSELVSSPYVQSVDEMRKHLALIPHMNQQLFDMLDSLILEQ